MNINSNTYSQAGAWERRQSPIKGDCHRTNMRNKKEPIFYFEYGIYNGVIAITPYGYLNIKSLSAKFYFLPILFCGALENSTLLTPNNQRGTK